MKSLNLLRLLSLLALLISLAGIPLYGQGQQQEPAPQSQTSMSQQSAQSQPSQMFVGKVAKSKAGDLLLKCDGGMSYKLDNADQTTPFVGKK
ncbi:MAG: hypothetical protein WCA13_06420, partial [Terriglobales bacterium]